MVDKPAELIREGETVSANLRRNRITLSDLKAELRLAGIGSRIEVVCAILETEDKISFIRRKDLDQSAVTSSPVALPCGFFLNASYKSVHGGDSSLLPCCGAKRLSASRILHLLSGPPFCHADALIPVSCPVTGFPDVIVTDMGKFSLNSIRMPPAALIEEA